MLLLVGEAPIKQFVLCEKTFGWMDVWELNPEELVSIWLMDSVILDRWTVPF
jgi:hypothetical protein